MATATEAPTATEDQGQDSDRRRRAGGARFARQMVHQRGLHGAAGGQRAGSAGGHPADAEFDIALLDIKMPGMDGMELQARLNEADPDLTVVIMTGYASVDTAVQALKHGAYDYITKPVDPDELSHLVSNALEHKRARREVARLRENLQEVFPSTELIGKSPAMKKVVELIEMVAPTEATVLITGESGTGKEVVARAIHAAGPRRYMPMVTIHCGALTETLLESELFGHEKGAFTGAQYRKKGKFEVADGGSVFLDEISDISLKTQTDLLRVLQEKEIVRVGGNQQIKVDFRCIAATNKNLETLVKAGHLPARPVLPAARLLHRPAAAARPPRRHSAAGGSFPQQVLHGHQPARAADFAGGAGGADAPRLAGQRARAGERRGARPGGGPRPGDPAGRFLLPVPGRGAAAAARRWTTWSAPTSSAFCARRSTIFRARRGFWTSTAPPCTTSCAVTDCGEADSSHPAGQRFGGGIRLRHGTGPEPAGAPGGLAGAHLPRAVPHPAGTVRRFVLAGRSARPVLLHRHHPAAGARQPTPTRACWASRRATSTCRC